MNKIAFRLGRGILLGIFAVTITNCDLVSEEDRGEVSLQTDKTFYAPESKVHLRLENNSDKDFSVSSLCQLKIQRFEKLSWVAVWQLESCYAVVISVEEGDSFEFDLDLPESLPGGSLRYSLGGVGSNSFTVRKPATPHPESPQTYAIITTDREFYRPREEYVVRIDKVTDSDLFLFHTCGMGLQKWIEDKWYFWVVCAGFFPLPAYELKPGENVVPGITIREPGTYRYVLPIGLNSIDQLPSVETTSNVFHVGEPTRGANRQ